MLAMPVPWIIVLLASRVAYADFHFLSCVSSGGSATLSNPTIAVPASSLGSCDGILGPTTVTLQNLTQPVGKASVFSIDNFCDARRLDVYLASSDLLGIFVSGGDGTLIGECSPSPPRNFSCSSQSLSLDCSDSWTCFSGICEAPREDSVTTQSPSSSSPLPSSSVSVAPSGSSTTAPASSTSGADNSPLAAPAGGGATVLGITCLCLALTIALLVWRRRRKVQEIRAPDNPPMENYTVVAPRVETIQPFLATQTSQSLMSSLKTSGRMSVSLIGLSSPAEREEVREAQQARSRSIVTSWRTDALPPSYSHRGEGSEYQAG
ncbi:hypothetical protein FB451DRAFT_1263012 [Mycena latifolia]|nr:hypothetical protein FB451DRAFT_1263012 [Mycena latifolia]